MTARGSGTSRRPPDVDAKKSPGNGRCAFPNASLSATSVLEWRSESAQCRALLRSGRSSFTLGPVNRFVVLVSALVLLATGVARAQIIPPPQVAGPARGALQQLRPPSPLEQVREQAMRRSPPLPLPAPPSERWVPERRVYLPAAGGDVLIPGHYERRISDQQYAVPTLPAYGLSGGGTVVVPGGERPPADLRQGP